MSDGVSIPRRGFCALQRLPAWRWLRRLRIADWAKQITVVVVSVGLVASFYFVKKQVIGLIGIDDGFYTEILGILLTVLLIDGLRSVSLDVDLRASLLRRAASSSNETAKAAIDELKETWPDALREADLSGANLRGAVLENADLSGAILVNADLRYANLKCAILTGANLVLDQKSYER